MKTQKSFRKYIKKTFLKYSVVTVTLIFSLYIVSLYFTFNLVVVKKNKQANQEISLLIDHEFNEYRDGLNEITNNESVQLLLTDSSFLWEVNNLLYQFRNDRKIKSNFALLNNKGEVITTSLYKDNINILKEDYIIQSLLKQLDFQGIVQRTLDTPMFEGGQESTYFFAKPIHLEQQQQGYLFFFLDDFGNNIPHQADIVAITDSFDQVIYVTDSSLITHLRKLNPDYFHGNTATINANSYYVTSQSVTNQDIQIISMLSIETFKQSVWIGIISLLGIEITIILLIHFALPKIINQNLRSFDLLLHFIHNPKKQTKTQKFREFQIIQDEFANKIEQIQSLMKANEEIAETKRKMEIKQLESQFNPHFAFNVLEMLRYEILFDPENASKIVVLFANLLRYNIHYGSTLVPIEADINYVEDYLKLQKKRFGKRLDYSIRLEASIKDVKIPKLIIQPLIENSIKHCMEESPQLKITINIYQKDNVILMSVVDNGKGISKEKLVELQQILEKERNESNHYGIFHSHRVVQLIFGKQYGLTIDSVLGEGTRVQVKIPYIKGDLKHV